MLDLKSPPQIGIKSDFVHRNPAPQMALATINTTVCVTEYFLFDFT